jgi:hypothetical protein
MLLSFNASSRTEALRANEAHYNPVNYPLENPTRIKLGRAPQRLNIDTGKMESLELHHTIPQRSNTPNTPKVNTCKNLWTVWPEEHEEIDLLRHTGRQN